MAAGYRIPINHYSRIDRRVAWLVQFDQAIDPKPSNLDRSRLGLQYLDSAAFAPETELDVDLLKGLFPD